ncbi:MAG: hypothetical protein J5805_05195 [Bacteroidaceae bacterium]|nr:hypothetical protein [Bacteroidaceae bacterium]
MRKTILFTLGFALALVLIISCGNKSNDGNCDGSSSEVPSLVGQWEYNSFVYDFQNETEGTYMGTMKFTYKNTADSLYITYENSESPLVLAYRVDGDKLIVTDSNGLDVEYNKK